MHDINLVYLMKLSSDMGKEYSNENTFCQQLAIILLMKTKK